MSVSENRQRNREATGRETCARCLRPQAACYCAHVKPVATRTRLVLLQHPREAEVAIGTAHMASLCLSNSELHVGVDWSASSPLKRALSDPARPAILLYPGEDATDIVASPPPGPVTLVVVDGTWAQTKKVVRTNPVLAGLPRYAFVPPSPSEYRIRKEPNDASVATIEALVHALGALEGESFEALLAPFRAMIDFQIECQSRFHGARVRHARHRERPRRMRVPHALDQEVVLVAGEANSWPYTMREDHPDELVQWAAYRPSTGEVFAATARPGGIVAPATSLHTGIAEEELQGAGSLAELHERWRAFARPADVIASWGRYETSLFVRAGGWLPEARVDLRQVAREVARGTVGALTDYRATLGAPSPELPFPSAWRARRKLEATAAVLASFRALPH